MWLRTVRRACESHHRSTDTAQGRRATTAPGAPPQGLAAAQGKVFPGPHSRLGALGTRQSHHTGYALKPAHLFTCCFRSQAGSLEPSQLLWKALEQKGVRPRYGVAQPSCLSVHAETRSRAD